MVGSFGENPVRPSVLLIEDEPMLCEVLELLLSDTYVVTAVLTATEACDRVRTAGTFDAILCDLRLPGMSGAAFYLWLEKEYPSLCPRVVFTSGGNPTADEVALLRRIPNRCLDKPVTVDVVEAALRSVLGR